VTFSPVLTGIRASLLDVEGTTTPISFVVDVLFPYARRHLRRHLNEHAASAEHSALIDRLRDEYHVDALSGDAAQAWVDTPMDARLASAAAYCAWLMDRDRKSSALKELQGRIWEEGYTQGEIVGEVFADVPAALARWRAEQKEVGIFSSGSVRAQQLLFRHSSSGDLSGYLRWHFDTAMGSKKEAESYRRIATAMALPPASILFVSDVTEELDAARTAGMQTRLSIRPGNPVAVDVSHIPIESFDL
jgi:enolase-phosphatase E1